MWRVKYSGNKYKARSTVYNGNQYHSLFEAGYAQGLDLRQKAGDIKEWKRQVRFSLYGKNGGHICDYILDFVITNNDGTLSYIHEAPGRFLFLRAGAYWYRDTGTGTPTRHSGWPRALSPGFPR